MVKMTAFDDAWNILKYGGPKGMDGLDDDGNYPQGKTEPINMQEYPAGSGRFMDLRDMMEARNADARKNMERMDNNMGGRRGPNVGGQPSTNALAGNQQRNIMGQPSTNAIAGEQQRNNIMVNSKTGVYDPNDPEGWHPL